jgi:phosphate starvation-inducible PhoH-like protein
MAHNRKSIGAARKQLKSEWNIFQTFKFTPAQQIIVDKMLADETNCIILDGLAGTGKSHMAIYSALRLLQEKKIDKILYVRTVVEAAHSKMGYLKGQIDEKFAPYVAVLEDKLSSMLSAQDIETLKKNNSIEAQPVAFLRGRDFSRTALIFDEAQNAYVNEIFTLLTRCARESKVFLIADSDQCDLPNGGQQEFAKIKKLFDTPEAVENNIFYHELKEDDHVMRSPFVKYVTRIYRDYKQSIRPA